jgi:hypothetical protein
LDGIQPLFLAHGEIIISIKGLSLFKGIGNPNPHLFIHLAYDTRNRRVQQAVPQDSFASSMRTPKIAFFRPRSKMPDHLAETAVNYLENSVKSTEFSR